MSCGAIALILGVVGCPGTHDLRQGTTAPSAADPAQIELVESAPIETTLDRADVPNASEVWPKMIDRATRTLDVSQFYASEAEGDLAKTSLLAPVVSAIERAAARGVRVRFLVERIFVEEYPTTLDRLRAAKVDVHIIAFGKLAGGIQHAKYFVVDGTESFIGSQNFDWRALAHIHEIGARIRSPVIAGALSDVFETDWALAGGANDSQRVHAHAERTTRAATGEELTFVASPRGWLPDEGASELDAILGLLSRAKERVDLQVLHHSKANRDHSTFTTLDDALRSAAARGVRVRLLVSHWGSKPGSPARGTLDAIQKTPNVEVRIFTIPPWSGGDIPFARVAHAKYLVVDRGVAWIGTSNWEGDYFLKSRNVGIVIAGGKVPAQLDGVFEGAWSSAYAAPLSPTAGGAGPP